MPFLTVDRGAFLARISSDKGDLELAGPDLQGNPLANVLKFGPPEVTTAGGVLKIGRVSASTTIADGLELQQDLGGKAVKTRLTFPSDGVMRYEVLDWQGTMPQKVAVSAASDRHEHFYGFGEKFNAFDQAGKQVNIVTFDQPGNKGDHSYKAVPWFVSTRGYGFHFDSTAESGFDLRATKADRFIVTSHFPVLKFNVVYGPKLTDVLTRFANIAGKPHPPPTWVFGPWISSDIWRNGGEVRYVVTRWRQQGLPASVFVFDSPWETAYNDFKFNMTQFGHGGTFENNHFDGFQSLAEMMKFLQQNGLKVICWMTPFINDRSLKGEFAPEANGQLAKSGNFEDGKEKNVFVLDKDGKPFGTGWWKGHGSPIDFTKPAARIWLVDQLQALIVSSEVATRDGSQEPAIGGFKTDDGEALTNPPQGGNINAPAAGEYIPNELQYADGRTGQEMRNAYCVEYFKTVAGVLGTKGIIFARSGSIGTQAFPACWAGDNEPNFGNENGLPSVIIAGQSAAMSGFSLWGHDIGGYINGNFSPTSPENLFIRWTQFGCFSPIMQLHRQVADVKQDNPKDLRQYPWGYGKEALDNFRFFARLHTQLFPYIYKFAKESTVNGLPIIRPLVLMHPEDPGTFPVRHTYYFGNEFLVAPVVKPTKAGMMTQRDVFLPAGTNWFDFWNSDRHEGGKVIHWVEKDQQRFPLFVREGGIVPMLLEVPDTLCDVNYVNNPAIRPLGGGLQFLIYPGDKSDFTLHDDTRINCAANGAAITIAITSVARSIELKVFSVKPGSVVRDGAVLTEHTTLDAFNAATSGWLQEQGFTRVKLQHAGGLTVINF